MRTTIILDDVLLAEAQRLTGLQGRSALVREALKALIERESARRLARLSGSESTLRPTSRRRHDSDLVLAELWDNPQDAAYDQL